MTPATLRFEAENFLVFDEKMAQIRGMRWAYDEPKEIVCRARPLHLDVRYTSSLSFEYIIGTACPISLLNNRFQGKERRFRLASSYIQAIVNEFFFRSPEAKTVFEPIVRQFDYGSPLIVVAPKTRYDAGSTTFFGVKKSTADLLSDEVAPEVISNSLR